MACMKCSEKEDLQQECTAKWNDYTAAITESSFSVDPSNGTVKPLSISELVAMGRYDATPYAAAVRLRGEHLRASMELSKHLSRHRC